MASEHALHVLLASGDYESHLIPRLMWTGRVIGHEDGGGILGRFAA